MRSIPHRHKKRTAAVLAGLLGCGIALGTTMVRSSEAAPPPPTPATPTITSVGPTGTINVRTASFAYSNPVNVAFFCSLDGSAYVACSASPTKTGSVSYAGLVDGSHTFNVVARIGTPQSAPATRSWFVDATRPTVLSITRIDANPHALGVVRWLVTFSEPVINVALSNFDLASTGLGGSPSLVSITPNAGPSATYTVSANSGPGTSSSNPTTRLDLSRAGSIRDVNNNALNNLVNGETYNFDATAPVVTVTKVNGSPVSFPYFTNTNVTSIGGQCGTALGDLATVTVTVTGFSPVSAPCTSGSWSLTLSPALSAGGAYTVSAIQVDTFAHLGTSGVKTLTIDKTAPVVALTKVNGAPATFPYSTFSTVTSIGGTCTTGDGSVKVTITARPDALVACTSGTWSLVVSLATGTYTITATQTDAAGNTGTSGAKAITVGTTDTVAPIVTLTSVNGSTSIEGSPITFPLTTSASVASVGGACGVLSGDLTPVSVTITGPAPSTAVARSGTATCSAAGTWSFTLLTALPNTAAAGLENLYTIAATQLDSSGNLGTTGPKQLTIATYQFAVSGTSVTPLTPGTTSQLDLVVKNPYSFNLQINSITVAFSTSFGACDGPTNFDVASGLVTSAPIIVPPSGSGPGTPMPRAIAPVIRMKNLPTNQDACKVLTGPIGSSSTITLTFGGTAVRP
jgi:hypothetical protein